MYPAPPVTRMLRAIVPLETEQFLQRFEETVSSAGLRGLLECDRGMVQELVEQRVTELLHLGAILGRQMRETFERALQLSGTHVVEPPPKLFEHGHGGEPGVPGPEAVHFVAHYALGCGHLMMAVRSGVRGHGLQVVDIVQKHVLELADRGLHIARHGQVEDAQRPRRAPRPPPRRAPSHCARGRRRAGPTGTGDAARDRPGTGMSPTLPAPGPGSVTRPRSSSRGPPTPGTGGARRRGPARDSRTRWRCDPRRDAR